MLVSQIQTLQDQSPTLTLNTFRLPFLFFVLFHQKTYVFRFYFLNEPPRVMAVKNINIIYTQLNVRLPSPNPITRRITHTYVHLNIKSNQIVTTRSRTNCGHHSPHNQVTSHMENSRRGYQVFAKWLLLGHLKNFF